MIQRFDRADPHARALKQCYRDLGETLGHEASSLRSEIHARHYPQFGEVTGLRRKALLRRLRGWDDLFRDHGEQIFRLSFDIEQKLVESLSQDRNDDHRLIFDTVRRAKKLVDQILRAMSGRMQTFLKADPVDTQTLSQFGGQAEEAALFLQFTGSMMMAAPGTRARIAKDGRLFDLDWDDIERMGQDVWRSFEAATAASAAPVQQPPRPAPRPATSTSVPSPNAQARRLPAPPIDVEPIVPAPEVDVPPTALLEPAGERRSPRAIALSSAARAERRGTSRRRP